jgi:polyphosphate kinase
LLQSGRRTSSFIIRMNLLMWWRSFCARLRATLCSDAARLFNFFTGYARPAHLEKLAISPVGIKARLLDLIAAEITHAKACRPAAIWAKLNALTDVDMIEALYRASRAGVSISLVIRGMCSLRPGVGGLF